MRRLRRARNLLLALLALAALGVAFVAVEFIATRGRTPSISEERAAASLEKLRLGGADQWVLIRGHDRNNPICFFCTVAQECQPCSLPTRFTGTTRRPKRSVGEDVGATQNVAPADERRGWVKLSHRHHERRSRLSGRMLVSAADRFAKEGGSLWPARRSSR
jgi:hypothetical protein